jgi:catechol 2,3-dioxygenase-like lactoylglutathione lyase family enzyme
MIKEVAFVAVAVSDKERARKFYQETLELKPARTQLDGAWVEYDLGPQAGGAQTQTAMTKPRMTNVEGSQNAQMTKATLEPSSLIRISSFLRASSFVIRHFHHVRPCR